MSEPNHGFWRAIARSLPVAVPVIFANAAGQALLIAGSPPTLLTWTFVVRVIGSIALMVVAAWLLALAVRSGVDGVPFRVRRPSVMLWTAAVVLLSAAGWAVLTPYVVPVVLFAGLAVIPAVVIGEWNPFRAGWSALVAHPIRSILLIVLSVALAPISWFASLAAGFFVTGPLGAILAWLWLGVVALFLLMLWSKLLDARPPRG